MSILTGLVIVVAMATLAQRSDALLDFFFTEKEASISPQNDAAAMFAGDRQIIDVLANDENAKPEDADNIHILVSPSCGAAEATQNGVLYISNDRCVGPQLFAYCVKRGDECASASVTVNVAEAQPDRQVAQQRQPEPQTQRQPQPVPQQQTTPTAVTPQVAKAKQPRIEQPDVQVAGRRAPDTAQAGAQQDVAAAQGGASQNPFVAPQLRMPTPVVDDGGQASVAIAEAAPQTEGSFFDRLFLSPPDDSAASDAQADAPPRVAVISNDEQWRPSQAPDVSQIAPPAPQIEIAAVTTDTGQSTRDLAQQEEAKALPPSSAAANGATPGAAAPAERTRCDVAMTTRPGQGGMSRVELRSDCYAATPLVVLHAGLEFGARFSAEGVATLELPVMDVTPTINARLEDGAIVTADLQYDRRSVEQTHRIAIAWTAPVNLDLHAFEYSAGFGADGHVWEQHPRGFRDVRRPGGGFHTSYPAAVIDGQSIEVYTFWANRRTRPGYMRIAVDHASRGAVADGEFCGQGALASPKYTVVRSELGVITDVTLSSFAPATCGQALGEDVRYANSALADLRITE